MLYDSRLPPPKRKFKILGQQVDSGFVEVEYSVWIRGRVVRVLSLRTKGPEFDPSVRPLVEKIANHC